jgi:DUF971 family protein
MQKSKPVNITADRHHRRVIINWKGGHVSEYPFDGLRTICPCVECRGGHEFMGTSPDPKEVLNAPSTDMTLEQLSAVGSYALQFVWGDGHSAGIYAWEYLRDVCPCPRCLDLQ